MLTRPVAPSSIGIPAARRIVPTVGPWRRPVAAVLQGAPQVIPDPEEEADEEEKEQPTQTNKAEDDEEAGGSAAGGGPGDPEPRRDPRSAT